MIVRIRNRILFQTIDEEYEIYEVSPSTSVRNRQSAVLGRVIADFYKKEGWFLGSNPILSKTHQHRVNFRITIKPDEIRFYFLVPKERAGEILRKIETIYDENITINPVESLPRLIPEKSFCCELGYRQHDIFSLKTDKDDNYPLSSLLSAVRTTEDDDIAVFDALVEPTNRLQWLDECERAIKRLEQGFPPSTRRGNKILELIDQFFNSIRYELLELTALNREQKRKLKKWQKEQNKKSPIWLLYQERSPSTKRKIGDEVLNVWMRIAVQSENLGRAKSTAHIIANAWKDISGDNELDCIDVTPKWRKPFIESIEKRHTFCIRMRPNHMSVDETGKIFQLPGLELINEYEQIQAQMIRSVAISPELTQDVQKKIRIGVVTERGTETMATLPLEPFGNVAQKDIYDFLCTVLFCQGRVGSGKTEGFGTSYAYDMLMSGFSCILIDTADGQGLRNLVNALPEDYPDEKLHLLDYDNKAWPIPTDWSDIYGRSYGDDEMQAIEIQERITNRLITFINGLSNTGAFTDRMEQYLVSCMRAITLRPGWSFLDLELALMSKKYREELLQLPQIQDMPEVMRDLQTLQQKADRGSDSFVEPVLNRLRILGGTQSMANLFYQPPKLDENGKPLLDLRKIMDNPEGGYGHLVCVYASQDSWQKLQSVVLGFFYDKVNFNAFGRVDVKQADRKPALVWLDEPHKVIGPIQDGIVGTAVEFRKYRLKQMFTGHSIEQMGRAANALLDGGAQIVSYKTRRLSEFERYAHMFAPYDDAKTLYETLPEKWRAICAFGLPSGATPSPAFIAQMMPPPKFVKNRDHLWQACAEKYGRYWKDVRAEINQKRQDYLE